MIDPNLAHAIASEDIKEVRALLRYDEIDIEATDSLGNTPLLIACLANNFEIAEMLLKLGADPNVEDVYHNTPLSIAIMNNNEALVKMLLYFGAILDSFSGTTSFEIFCLLYDLRVEILDECLIKTLMSKECEIRTVHFLLDIGLNPNFTDEHKRNALHYACIFIPIPRLLQLLIARGVDVNHCDETNRTPVQYLELHEASRTITDCIMMLNDFHFIRKCQRSSATHMVQSRTKTLSPSS